MLWSKRLHQGCSFSENLDPLTKNQSIVASVLFYAVVCWGNSITADDRNRINNLNKTPRSKTGCTPDSIETVLDIKTRKRLRTILEKDGHPLHDMFDSLWSTDGGRLIMPKCPTEHFRKTFVPLAVQLVSIK